MQKTTDENNYIAKQEKNVGMKAQDFVLPQTKDAQRPSLDNKAAFAPSKQSSFYKETDGFSVGRSPTQATADKSKGRRAKQKKRKIAPAGILALVLAAAILTITAGIILVQFVFFNQANKPVLAEEDRIAGRLTMSLDAVDATKTYPLGTNLLLQVNEDKIAILNLKGSEEYSLDTGMQEIAVQQSGEHTLLVDRLGYQYLVLSAQGPVYTGNTSAPILGYHLSEEGYLALLLEAEGTKGIVRVLQPNGEFLFDWTIQDDKESGYVLAAKFGVESKSLFVSMLNVAGAKPFPIIKKISLAEDHFREIVAQYSPTVAEALPVILPLANDQTVFVGESSLHLVEGNRLQEPLHLSRVARAGQVGRGFYLLASNQASGAFYLNMINGVHFPSEVDDGYAIQDFPREINASKAYMAMSIGDDLYRFSLNSNQPEIFHMQGKLLRFSVADDGSVLCICSDGVRQIAR